MQEIDKAESLHNAEKLSFFNISHTEADPRLKAEEETPLLKRKRLQRAKSFAEEHIISRYLMINDKKI
jgi:hypothetical protein